MLPGTYLVRLTLTKSDVKTTVKTENKTEGKTESKTENKTESKTESKTENKTVITKSIHVEDDPRLTISNKDRQNLFKAQMRVYKLNQNAEVVRAELTAIRDSLNTLEESDKFKSASPKVKEQVTATQKLLTKLLDQIVTPQRPRQETATVGEGGAQVATPTTTSLSQRLSRVSFDLEGITEKPAQVHLDRTQELESDLKKLEGASRDFQEGALSELKKLLKANSLSL